MPKKTKGKKGVKIVQDLHSFNNSEVKKVQEKEFTQSQKSSKEESKASANVPSIEVNECEERV